jgi:hypothetical protein
MAHGLNQPLLATAANPVNCGYDGSTSACITTNTSKNAKLRVPVLGETPTALMASEFVGHSSYHSLQATFRRQISRVLTLQSAYTLSKAMNNNTVYNDQNRIELSNGRASFDRTHRLVTNFDYQLPSPQSGSGWKRGLWTGWSLAGIIVAQSGMPMTLTDPSGGTVYSRAGTSTITMCGQSTYADLITAGGTKDRLNQWINPSAICAAPALGADGSTGYGNSGVSIINGPGQVNTDFSFGKRSRVGGLREDASLIFRVEFYNALNSAQFSNPGTTLGTASFGVITQTSVAPRLIQFALKYMF